jgi:hypothetical protein
MVPSFRSDYTTAVKNAIRRTDTVALRVELFSQVHFPDLAQLGQRKFAALCERYGFLPTLDEMGFDRVIRRPLRIGTARVRRAWS